MFVYLYLHHVIGRVVGPFRTLDEVADHVALHGLSKSLGDAFRVPMDWSDGIARDQHYHTYDWVLRNDHGQTFKADTVLDILRERRHQARIARRVHLEGFRDRPVPGIHVRRLHRGAWWRHPSTQAEIRAYDAYEEDRHVALVEDGIVLPSVRGRRKALPTSWEDMPRHKDKCWKSFRRTQFKKS